MLSDEVRKVLEEYFPITARKDMDTIDQATSDLLALFRKVVPKKANPNKGGSYSLEKSWAEGFNSAIDLINERINIERKEKT